MGQITPALLDPSKCQVRGKGVEVAAVGEEATALLQAIDYTGKPCEVFITMSSLECELASEIQGSRAKMQCREKRTEPVPDLLPAHHQG